MQWAQALHSFLAFDQLPDFEAGKLLMMRLRVKLTM